MVFLWVFLNLQEAQKEYEKSADKAYTVGQALNNAKMKKVEACSEDESSSAKDGKEQMELAASLEEDAKDALLKNDTKGGWVLQSSSFLAELKSKYSLLMNEDDTRKTIIQNEEEKMEKMNILSIRATQSNRPELAKLIRQKIEQMNSTVHGAKVSQHLVILIVIQVSFFFREKFLCKC